MEKPQPRLAIEETNVCILSSRMLFDEQKHKRTRTKRQSEAKNERTISTKQTHRHFMERTDKRLIKVRVSFFSTRILKS